MNSYLDVIRPFADRAGELTDVQIVGGIAAAALAAPSLEIDSANRAISIDDPKELGDHDSLDISVLSTDRHRMKTIDRLAGATIGRALIRTVSGLQPMAGLQRQQAHPLMSLAKVWQPALYADMEKGRITEVQQALYPFVAGLSTEALETWQLHIADEDPIPVPHPGMTIMDALTRHMTGIRPSDREEVDQIAANVFDAAPEVREWIRTGPGAGRLVFARMLHGLSGVIESSVDRAMRMAEESEPEFWLGSELQANMLLIEPLGALQIRRQPEFPIDDENLAWRALRITQNKARLLRFISAVRA